MTQISSHIKRIQKPVTLGVIAVFLFMMCAAKKLYAVVGHEDIDRYVIEEVRDEHEEIVDEEQKKKEEEKRAYLMKLLEEKRKSAAGTDSAEAKNLQDEIAKLKSEVLQQKKSWRDRVRLTPTERIVFDSNIRNQKDAKSDIIFNSGTGVRLDLGTKRTQIDLNYDGAHARYLRNPKLSRFEHRLNTSVRYPVSSKTQIDASYGLTSTGNQTSEIRSIINRLRQDIALVFKQRMSQKTGFRLAQTYSDLFFYRSSREDDASRQYVISPEFNYFVSKKTSVFTRYALGFSGGGVGGSNRSIAHEFRGGLRGKIAPKTSILLDLGFSHQRQLEVGRNQNAFVGEVVLITNVTRKSRLELLVNRSFSQAIDTAGSNFFITENYRLTGITQFRRYLYGDVSAGLRRNIFEQNGSVSNPDQKDLILELATSLRYDFLRWLGLELRYTFATLASKQSSREYDKHVLSLAFNGKY